MTGPFAIRIFRIVFILAGFYNLGFGLWAALWPGQFFEIFRIAPPHYPQIWGCLGMVLGLYGMHLLGLLAMALVLQPGLATQPVALQRALYIAQHSAMWTVAWSTWMLCAISLLGMYIWWGSRLSSWRIAMMGTVLAALGCLCDLSGESLGVLVLVERGSWTVIHPTYWDRPAIEVCERIITLLTAGFANAFYTLGGIILMWCTTDFPRAVRLLMWGTWTAGIAMTIAAVFNGVSGMVAATVVLFPLLILWAFGLGQYWRRA